MKNDEYIKHIQTKLDESEREATSPDAKWYTHEQIKKMSKEKLKEVRQNKNVIKYALQA